MKLSSALFLSSGVAVLFAALPIISVIAAAAVASIAGCTSNESGAHACMILGYDAGSTLYNMSMAFWLFIFTWLYIPVAIGLALAAVIVLGRGRTNPSQNSPVSPVFWLLFVAAMILPLASTLALCMFAVALFLWWRRKRSEVESS